MIFILFLAIFSSVNGQESFTYKGDNPFVSWPMTCQNGTRQSPIDFKTSDVKLQNLTKLDFQNYEKSGFVNVINTGNSVQINGFARWPNPPFIINGGLSSKYNLQQMHFHWSTINIAGSEHTVDGRHYPVEIHMVHFKETLTNQFKSVMEESDGIAVVGIFVILTNSSQTFLPLESSLRQVINFNSSTEIIGFSPGNFLPQNTEVFYRYLGSLTTPQCNENVIWTVLTNPANISINQLNLLRNIHDFENTSHESNFRPTQSLNGRIVMLRDPLHGKSSITNLNILIFLIAMLICF